MTGTLTPWLHLRGKKVGWDVLLDSSEIMDQALDEFMGLDEARFNEWSRSARHFARQVVNDPSSAESLRGLLQECLEDQPKPGFSELGIHLETRPLTPSGPCGF
jgi:hypothetical protein